MNKVKTISQLNRIANFSKKKGKAVGLVTGVFDVLHFEHVEFLSFAKKKADVLVIGLESDENVRLFKGKGRPIFNFKQRAFVLSALECVDFVFRIPKIKGEMGSFYGRILKEINPDVLFSAVFSDNSWKEKKKKAEKAGIKLMPYDKKPKTSSSRVVSFLSKIA